MGLDARAAMTANEAFYRAFCDRDVRAMRELWAREVPVSCTHPGRGPMRDRDEILMSWQAIFEDAHMPDMSPEDVNAAMLGSVACITCFERLTGLHGEDIGLLVATNLFVRESGAWRLAHHHSSPLGVSTDDEDDEEDPPTLLN